MGEGGLEQLAHLLGVAGKAAGHKAAPGDDGLHAQVDRGKLVVAGVFELEALFRGGRELPLGEAVYAVVLHDVNHPHVAAHQVLKLPHPNAAGIAVARDPNGLQGVVG